MRHNHRRSIRTWAVLVSLFPLLWLSPSPALADHHMNPCEAKKMNPCKAKKMNPCKAETTNPCKAKAMNPCKAKGMNPCKAKTMNPCNPCAGTHDIDPARFKQPRGARLQSGNHAELLAEGEKLWNDPKLGESGLACATCHINNYTLMQSTFAKPYPHMVAMAKQRADVDSVNASEMVNFCMVVPMQDEALAWNSRELAALTAYVESIRPNYKPIGNSGMVNPCSKKMNACNPCSKKRANPCARKK